MILFFLNELSLFEKFEVIILLTTTVFCLVFGIYKLYIDIVSHKDVKEIISDVVIAIILSSITTLIGIRKDYFDDVFKPSAAPSPIVEDNTDEDEEDSDYAKNGTIKFTGNIRVQGYDEYHAKNNSEKIVLQDWLESGLTVIRLDTYYNKEQDVMWVYVYDETHEKDYWVDIKYTSFNI